VFALFFFFHTKVKASRGKKRLMDLRITSITLFFPSVIILGNTQMIFYISQTSKICHFYAIPPLDNLFAHIKFFYVLFFYIYVLFFLYINSLLIYIINILSLIIYYYFFYILISY